MKIMKSARTQRKVTAPIPIPSHVPPSNPTRTTTQTENQGGEGKEEIHTDPGGKEGRAVKGRSRGNRKGSMDRGT